MQILRGDSLVILTFLRRRAVDGALIAAMLGLTACMSAQEHRQAVSADQGDRLTVGTVQREIKVGMTSGQVVEILGSPNMVTTDEQRREVWVYDRVSTETAYSTSSGGVNALVLGGAGIGAGLLGGGVGGGVGQSAGAVSQTQRTITIIIKFDNQSRVRDFAYRSSAF
jgi:outer membrane protein assembly factor BamE (lipoprotein component of BamABCDE complex)